MKNKKVRRIILKRGETALKKIFSLTMALIITALAVLPASAGGIIPYDSYIYDYWEDMVLTPAPYIPGRSVTGVSVGVGAFSSPEDIAVGPDGIVYIADTGNNRIVVLNEDMTRALGVIKSFIDNGIDIDENDEEEDDEAENSRVQSFNAPFGVAVSPTDNQLYVADSMNNRIVALEIDFNTEPDEEYDYLVLNAELRRTISNPQSEMFDEGFVFTPLKVAVDYANRVYAIARGMFQGIMVFDQEGEFTGFFGTIDVQISTWEIIWRMLSTRAQLDGGTLFVPTEFTGIDVDDAGFIYASNIDYDGQKAVRRLNPRGEDVIRTGENENLGGDLSTMGSSRFAGVSQITDVVYRGKGIYSLLCRHRGRIFTYDREGNLLYIFGGMGEKEGTFVQPVAIEALGDRIAVVDAQRHAIITFEVTQYGRLINEAVGLRFDGDEALAVEKWREVLKMNENLEIANIGIGKAYLTAGDNVNAMRYLRLGQSRTYYSIAYRRYRNDVLKENMQWILTGVLVLAVGIPITVKVIKKRKEGGGV
jgi:DNA-binding beta-propeller fold protein YncE